MADTVIDRDTEEISRFANNLSEYVDQMGQEVRKFSFLANDAMSYMRDISGTTAINVLLDISTYIDGALKQLDGYPEMLMAKVKKINEASEVFGGSNK